MYGDKSIDKPDWLTDDPTSDEAHQMVLNQSETLEQAQITGYMSGYFDGEGHIGLHIEKSNQAKIGFRQRPLLMIETAQMAGLFDAEGMVLLSPYQSKGSRLNHTLQASVKIGQAQDKTMIGDIFDSYNNNFDFNYSVSVRENKEPHHKPTVKMSVNKREHIKNFLAPLLPMLKEKQEQAIIMLREIIPRMERDMHLNKEGFIELMKWKELLDREKPMRNEDRKYTVEYFQDLWADDLDDDSQSDLTHFQSAHGD